MTILRRLLCLLTCSCTGHRLTVVVFTHSLAYGGTAAGRHCRCGHRYTAIVSDGTEREGTV